MYTFYDQIWLMRGTRTSNPDVTVR